MGLSFWDSQGSAGTAAQCTENYQHAAPGARTLLAAPSLALPSVQPPVRCLGTWASCAKPLGNLGTITELGACSEGPLTQLQRCMGRDTMGQGASLRPEQYGRWAVSINNAEKGAQDWNNRGLQVRTELHWQSSACSSQSRLLGDRALPWLNLLACLAAPPWLPPYCGQLFSLSLSLHE